MPIKEPNLQSEIDTRLKPWLDLAALMPFETDPRFVPMPEGTDTRKLIERVFQEGCAPRPDEPPVHKLRATTALAREIEIFPNGIFDLPQQEEASVQRVPPYLHAAIYPPDRSDAAQIFYALFSDVRFVLGSIVLDGRSLKSYLSPAGRLIRYSSAAFMSSSFRPGYIGFSEHVCLDSEGRVDFEVHPVWAKFKKAVVGIEADRLRCCPECRRIYYAVRRNKMACDEHLALAAVKRSQKKRSEYEAARQINQLVKANKKRPLKDRKSIGDATKHVRNRTKRRRKDG